MRELQEVFGYSWKEMEMDFIRSPISNIVEIYTDGAKVIEGTSKNP